jgi:hypothetical protein
MTRTYTPGDPPDVDYAAFANAEEAEWDAMGRWLYPEWDLAMLFARDLWGHR